nr:hypothetical protein REQ54_02067 [Rhizobium sp. Q54]
MLAIVTPNPHDQTILLFNEMSAMMKSNGFGRFQQKMVVHVANDHAELPAKNSDWSHSKQKATPRGLLMNGPGLQFVPAMMRM